MMTCPSQVRAGMIQRRNSAGGEPSMPSHGAGWARESSCTPDYFQIPNQTKARKSEAKAKAVGFSSPGAPTAALHCGRHAPPPSRWPFFPAPPMAPSSTRKGAPRCCGGATPTSLCPINGTGPWSAWASMALRCPNTNASRQWLFELPRMSWGSRRYGFDLMAARGMSWPKPKPCGGAMATCEKCFAP